MSPAKKEPTPVEPRAGRAMHLLDTWTDTDTGKTYRYGSGEEVDPPAQHATGNLADLQRGGALVAAGVGTMDDGVVLPEGVTEAAVQRGIIEDAKAGEQVHPKAEKIAKAAHDEARTGA